MKSRSWFVFAFALATAYSFAQNEIPLLNDSSTTMTTPAQLRRIAVAARERNRTANTGGLRRDGECVDVQPTVFVLVRKVCIGQHLIRAAVVRRPCKRRVNTTGHAE